MIQAKFIINIDNVLVNKGSIKVECDKGVPLTSLTFK